MRNCFFLIGLLFFSSSPFVKAQDRKIVPDTVIIDRDTLVMLGDSLLIQESVKETFWKKGGTYTLNIQQVTLSNWAAGGTGSFALNSGATLFANYKKDSKVWDTQLTVNLGFNRQNERDYKTRKTNDNFIFVSNYGYRYGKLKKVRVNTISQSPTKTTAGSGIGGFDSFYNFAEALSPLGNASADACADYIVTLFSDLTRMVTMQNLFHDGGYSFTGISEEIMDKFKDL